MKTRIGLLIWMTAVCLQGANASNIDLTDRFIPFQVTDTNVLSGTLETRFIPGSATLQVKPDFSGQPASQYYALVVPTRDETTVTINSRFLELFPVERTDSKVYMVLPTVLSEGENTIRIDRATPGPWAGTSMFNLRDSYEEAHFAEAFWESTEGNVGRSTRDNPPTNSQSNYDVLWYDCTWKPSMTTARLLPGTEVTMGARSLSNSLQTIDLNFDMNPGGGIPMQIDYLDSGPGTPALSYSYNSLTFILSVHFPAAIPSGTDFQVRIGYNGSPNPNHANKIFGMTAYTRTTSINNGGSPTVFTASQPYGGRVWWPSKDHPSDKATTSIQRIIVPTDQGYDFTAISNGKLESTTVVGNEKTFVWKNSYPIAPYLISMAVGNYVFLGGTYTSQDNSKTMSVGHWVYPHTASAEATGYQATIQIMNFFAEKFGEYPFIDEKYETAAWRLSSGIEHQTCTTMPSGNIADGLGRRNIHELAHQWFGDKITCTNWDHLWLQEGMASYCEALYYQHIYGDAYFRDYLSDWKSSGVGGPAVSPNAHSFQSAPYYRRGAWIWHMLRGALGDDAFYAGCRHYLDKGYTTAVSQPPGAPVDLQTSMEEGAELSPGALAPFFNQWLYNPNDNYASQPTYSFSATYNSSTQSANISIGQHQTGVFQMPVQIRLTDADSNTTTVKVPSGLSTYSAPLGDFVPVMAHLDPDEWILRSLRANINTASLPAGTDGELYSATLTSSGSGSNTWSKVSGPAWLSVSGGGTISGTPPAPGTYAITVQANNSNGPTQQATYEVIINVDIPPPAIVINEVLYENSLVSANSADTAEYVELYNTTNAPVNIGNWQVVLVNSSGAAASTVIIPGGTTLAAGDYYVLGNASTINAVYPGAVDLNTGWNESLSDAKPSGVVLKTNTGKRVDSVTYMADATMGSGSEASFARAEGGTGRVISAAITDTAQNVTLGRLPNGQDTGSNLRDFAAIYPSPGAPNNGVTLPFFDDFNSGARPEWRVAFQEPVRTASSGTGKPSSPSPGGGSFLEVYDSTGGGDVNFLPGAFDRLNMEGYIWIPQSSPSWSTGVGIGTRADSAWFSTTTGFALEHGFFLEYQNGNGIDLKGNRIANAPGQARLLACDASGSLNIGNSGFSATSLGTPATPTPQTWQPFRIYYDVPANKLFASIGGDTIYDGPLPTALNNISGGVVVGFRENHSGNPGPGNSEGTWVDDIVVNDNTSGIADYNLY